MNSFLTMLHEKEISSRAYNLTIGMMLFYGFLVNAVMCTCFTDVFLGWNPITILVGYFISCLVGILMSKSHNPILSFIGYNLVVLPIGVVLSIALADIYPGIVMNAFIVTSVLSGGMLLAAMIYPEFFEGLGRVLFFSLLITIIVEFVMLLTGMYIPTLIDGIVAVIFCLYIGYDWVVAQSYAHTYDNAIDVALSLYLDIINLFLRLVEIMAKNRD